MTAVAKKADMNPRGKVVDVALLPGLSRAQIRMRLANKAKAGRVAEMSFRAAGIKQGQS